MTVADVLAILTADDTERVIRTFTGDGPVWHLLRDRRQLEPALVDQLIRGADPTMRGQLLPEEDGLYPGVSQTYRWQLFSATLPNSTMPKRGRGRPKKPGALDAAGRMALTRARKGRHEVQTQILIAAMAEQLPPEVLARLQGHETFSRIIKDAQMVAKMIDPSGARWGDFL